MKRPLLIGISISILVLGWIYMFGPHRPYINWTPWDLADYLVENDRNARECLDLIWFEIMSPTQSEQRALCVYEYAKLTKKPEACELLMPSSYGLDCVGAAISFKRPCALSRERDVSGDGFAATIEECVSGPPEVRNHSCCTVSKARFVTGFNDCSSIKEDQNMIDQCYYNLAFKNHDPSECEQIQHANLRSTCEVSAKALRNNPAICQYCTLPIEVSDIK